MEDAKKRKLPDSFLVGVIALVFLVIGYQAALFIHRAAVLKIAAGRDSPDTVFIYRDGGSDIDGGLPVNASGGRTRDAVDKRQSASKPKGNEAASERHDAPHSPRAEAVRRNLPRANVETFRFNPNTVSVDDLCRLGFSPKQAASIDNYRSKGGHFWRKSDFAKSYVVSDSVFRRLEPFIDIPLVDLNVADSAEFDALPGIGGWFAAAIVAHRKALGGYSCKEQLMDIRRFDADRYEALADLVTVSRENVTPYPLWSLPADSLRHHPYIRKEAIARAIVLYRENNPRDRWTVQGLLDAGIIGRDDAAKLSRCALCGQ
ncbi:MAG: helix-hairpin-helix domain-containing protein [Candidatus Cryptobacteroides sp.]